MTTSPDPLSAYGWDARWTAAFAPLAATGLAPARVVLEHTHIYRIASDRGELLARVSGRLRHTAAGRRDFPAVGDWIGYRFDAQGGRALIHAIVERRSRLSRKIAGTTTDEQVVAANIDTIFIVMGLDRDFNARRLERYLVLAWDSGASPVVLLNKADLSEHAGDRLGELSGLLRGVPAHVTSARTEEGLAPLAPYLQSGRTLALIGTSGVGKSTIINRLIGRELLPTREVRASDSRGRHTTRHRQLVLLPGGAMLVDTPGMRELQLWESAQGFTEAFEDIESLAADCRFSDCQHRTEPDCAIRAAVDEGRISEARLENYLKLQGERRHLEERIDEHAQQEAKRRAKTLSKAIKNYHKVKGGS